MSLSKCLEYNWTLSNGVVLGTSEDFSRYFSLPGKNTVILTIKNNLLSSSRDITFYVVDQDSSYCIEGKSWLSYQGESGVITSSLNNCYQENAYGSRTTCCPAGQECISEGQKHYCSESVNAYISSCKGYENKDDCENDRWNVAEYGIEQLMGNEDFCNAAINVTSDGGFVYSSLCRCIWTDNGDGSGFCSSVWNESVSSDIGALSNSGTCLVKTISSIGDCSTDEYREEVINTTWTGIISSSNCIPGERKVKIPCGSTVTLGFFDWFGFIIAAVLIIVIYFVFFNKKKLKKTKSAKVISKKKK